ncbi:MAG: DinB family protein [Ktedonobacteraceae bacterium]|nr:DinB family protein [Ktedonobacteraceae bacterium]
MNAIDILKYGQVPVQQAIDGLPAEAWEKAGACGNWSTKDLIAHLTSFELILVDILTSLSGSSDTPTLNTYISEGNRFNDSEVEKRKQNSVQMVLAEFNSAHAQVMSLIERIPVETRRQPGTLPWYGMDYALDDVLVYMYYGHKREHSAQIAIFRDHLR